jgi:hypothetical protein
MADPASWPTWLTRQLRAPRAGFILAVRRVSCCVGVPPATPAATSPPPVSWSVDALPQSHTTAQIRLPHLDRRRRPLPKHPRRSPDRRSRRRDHPLTGRLPRHRRHLAGPCGVQLHDLRPLRYSIVICGGTFVWRRGRIRAGPWALARAGRSSEAPRWSPRVAGEGRGRVCGQAARRYSCTSPPRRSVRSIRPVVLVLGATGTGISRSRPRWGRLVL